MTDLLSKNGQLLLERSLLGFLLKGDFKFSVLRVGSNGKDKHGASTLVDFGTRDQETVTFLIASWWDFLNSIGLSGHGRFIGDNVVTFDNQTINWNDFSGFNELNIAYNKVVDWDVDDISSSNDVDELSLCYLIEFLELLFLDPVVTWSYSDDDDNSDEDWGSFVPTVLDAFCGDTQY